MRRTQIYLDEGQARRLDEKARASGRTRSELIREAVDAYLHPGPARDELDEFRRAVDSAFATAPDLPPGDEYVEALRSRDIERQLDLERRRRG